MTHTPAIFQLPLAVPFWIIFFLAFVREAKVVRPALGERRAIQDGGSFRALMIGSPLAVLAAVAVAYVPWLTMPSPVTGIVTGTILIVAGAVLRRYCFYALGTSFTGVVTVKQGQQIIESGLYRFVRPLRRVHAANQAIHSFPGVGEHAGQRAARVADFAAWRRGILTHDGPLAGPPFMAPLSDSSGRDRRDPPATRRQGWPNAGRPQTRS
ncbi:MAG: hypothetical protein KGL70_02300 [Betaproteobacteria bacterium]|nr:hypothetical protein [Betaproteobacteria bacterium]MDE2003647.1 hypothetical protein [Betaproteobacteria bacterium]MDE2210224.1 hypothetical protein [Betaproteobacteria bacterium]MDE2358198.1 hypothetical protein [Betaproteobacteria bacterium]